MKPAPDEVAATESDSDAVVAVENAPVQPSTSAVMFGATPPTSPQADPSEAITLTLAPATALPVAAADAAPPADPPAEETVAAGLPPAMPLEPAPAGVATDPTMEANPPGESARDADIPPVSDHRVPPADDAYLDEIILPSAILAPPILPEGTVLGPEGSVQVERLLDTRGRLNRYSALLSQRDETPIPIELREAPADHADLYREAEVLTQVRYAMLPQFLAAFEQDSRRYLALARPNDTQGTLAEALVGGLTPERAIAITLQLTQALRRLHAAGWALLGLQPAHIMLSAPLRITQLGTAARIGQESAGSLSVAGYSTPEVAHRAIVTGQEDVYTLGALLYRVLVGTPIPEEGPELAALDALARLPGAPQLLDTASAPIEERVDLETFYRHLLTASSQDTDILIS